MCCLWRLMYRIRNALCHQSIEHWLSSISSVSAVARSQLKSVSEVLMTKQKWLSVFKDSECRDFYLDSYRDIVKEIKFYERLLKKPKFVEKADECFCFVSAQACNMYINCDLSKSSAWARKVRKLLMKLVCMKKRSDPYFHSEHIVKYLVDLSNEVILISTHDTVMHRVVVGPVAFASSGIKYIKKSLRN